MAEFTANVYRRMSENRGKKTVCRQGNQFLKASKITGVIAPTNPKIKGENCVKARKNVEIFSFTHQNVGKPTKKPSNMAFLPKIRNFCAETNDLLAQ